MAFTFTNYAGIEPLESPFNDAIGKILSGYTDTTKARFLQPGLEEELKKARLHNQYYGPNIESEMALRKAQTGESGARTGLLGEQTRGARIENQYLPQKMQAVIQESQANAQKARLMQMIREQMMRGNSFSGMSQDTGNNASSQNITSNNMELGRGMFRQEPYQEMQNSNHSQPANNMDYAQAATAMQMLGLGKPEIIESNGKYLAITPFGTIDTGAKGLTAEEKALQSGFGKYGAKLYGDSIDAYNTYQNQGLALNELVDVVENNPQFRNVTGKINKPLANYFGSPAQKELLGRLQSTSGEIALQVAPALKGSFTGRDQTLINEIKASPNDFPDVFIGKLKAQKLINDVLTERSKLTAEYIEKGYKPLKAAELAAFETPLSRYKSLINQLTQHKKILSPEKLAEAERELERRTGK